MTAREIGISVTATAEAASEAAPADSARPSSRTSVLERELDLCTRFLGADHRNFHCHNYRRWIAAWLCLPAEADLDFTKGLIARNPSNFSAWHQRSQSLTRIHGLTGMIGIET